MPPRGQDMDATTFSARDVIGSEGIGQHGELLLDATAAAYPDELQAVQNYRPNDELNALLFGKGYDERLNVHAKIAKVTGLDDLELEGREAISADKRVLRATVRGGADENGRNRDSSQAWISYVALDDTGDNHFKGVFPFLDLDEKETDRHFSQLRAASETPAGKRYLEARLKQREAEGHSRASTSASDPVEFFRNAKASDVIGLIEQHPERSDEIKTMYEALHSKPAKSVLDFEAEGSGDSEPPPAGDGEGQGDAGGEGEPGGGSGGDS